MKNKKILISLASLLLVLGVSACGSKKTDKTPTANPTPTPSDNSVKLLPASIETPILDINDNDVTKVLCDIPGVTYRSSDENVVEVSSSGRIEANGLGNAYITVSKEGYYDRVLKVFVDAYNTVDYLVEGFEFGPAIVGVKLNLEAPVKQSDLAGVNFQVKTNNSSRTIESVDLCDEEGLIIDATESRYIRFSLLTQYSGWGVSGGAGCFTYANNVNNWTANIKVEVSLASGSSLKVGDETYTGSELKVSTIRARTVLSTRDWGEAKSHTAEGYTLTYKGYETDAMRSDSVKNPLVIWLHGMGEGGTDPDIALLGNDVTALGEREIQSHFINDKQKGAYVLAAQTPTYWMNSGTGSINGGVGHSIYTKTLKSLIDSYIEWNQDIDTNRIFIGGCSNGGYMTMEMAVTYGNFFRAFYPCCEAYSDSFVEDSDIENLKNYPMWFIHAANDTTVNANNFVIPTYQRLMRAGAEDIHFSYFVDVRGTDCNPAGNNYMGHYSWIYIFRDEVEFDQEDFENIEAPSTKDVMVNGKKVNLFDWMEAMK